LGLLRKSKSHNIKVLGLFAAALLLSLGITGLAAGAKTPPPKLVRISSDTTSTAGAQHATQVEPDAAAAGSRIVATFQVGRFFGGGATAIGFARSTDAGRTWRRGLLSAYPGAANPSDPIVARDALHGRWLISTLVPSAAGRSAVAVYGSANGLTWEAPIIAASYPQTGGDEGTAVDKEWITCDNGTASPHRGTCYLAYSDFAHETPDDPEGSHVAVQSSTDSGRTWSAPVLIEVHATSVSPGVQPVVRPNGELVVVFFEDGLAEAVRSNDGGATFSERERVSSVGIHPRPVTPTRLRSFTLPTATVDAAGVVYVAWSDCRFRNGCATNDIVWSRSTAPGVWTPIRRVPLAPLTSQLDLTLPDLAVSGRRLALAYYAVSSPDCTETNCLLNAYVITSSTAGARWSKPRRMNPTRMRLTWLAQTVSGRMVGDYTGVVFSGKRVVSVHVQARAPRAGQLNEAVYGYALTMP
jgi:hypothetical protein